MTDVDAKTASPKQKKQKVKLQLKSPSQQRSRQTVATILEACERIVIKEGFFGVSTDKIAKEAGVSIGSLYQFFGNKESVVSALIQDLMDKDLQFFRERVNYVQTLPKEQRVHALIQIGIDIYSIKSELRSRLQNIYKYLLDANYFVGILNVYEEGITQFLEPKNGRDPRMMAHIYAVSFEGLLDAAVAKNPNFKDDEKFVKEIFAMFEPYLLG
ncbi:MAG: TetR/AcrR family transcriptional regulator [Bdellovibrionota bacterium]